MLRIRWRWSGGGRTTAFDARATRAAAARHFGARHWRRAFRAYRRLAEQDALDQFVQIRLGDCARHLKKKEAAVEAYRCAMAGYAGLSDWSKATAACRLLIQMLPDDEDLPLHLASLESRRRLGSVAQPPPPRAPTPRAPGRDLSNIELSGWSDERPFDHWAGLDLDIRGRPRAVGGIGARAETEATESQRIANLRGALRTPAPLLVPVEKDAAATDCNDAMPEAVFEALYGTLSSAGTAHAPATELTLRHRTSLATHSEADNDEPCTCGRCHLCKPTTRRWTMVR